MPGPPLSRCRTRPTRSSVSISRAGSRAASTSARTPCWRSRGRATAGATSASATWRRRSARRGSAASLGDTGGWAPASCADRSRGGRSRPRRAATSRSLRHRGSRTGAGRDPRAGARPGRLARRRLQDPASRAGHGRPQRAVAGSDVEHGDRRPHRRRGATGRLKLRAWAPAARFLADAGGTGHRMPIGYLITVAVVALGMLLALRPVHRPAPLRTASWALGSIVNESPFVAFYWVLAATLLALAQGDLETPVGWVGLGIACVTFLATPVLVRRSLAARPAVEEALDDGLGPEWRGAIDPTLASRFRRSLPWVRILLAPVPGAAPWREAGAEPVLRRRGPPQQARRLPPPRATGGRADPHPPARRRVPHGPQEPLLTGACSSSSRGTVGCASARATGSGRGRSFPTTSSTRRR